MVQANAFRLGNLITLFDIQKPQIISVISAQVIQVKGERGEVYPLKCVKPINLNATWLRVFGFEYDEFADVQYWHNGTISLGANNRVPYFDFQHHILELNFVHQLQNLVFLITNKELEYKL